MKKLLVCAITSAAMLTGTANALADAGDWFVGLELAKTKHKVDASFSNGTNTAEADDKEKGTLYGIRLGTYLSDELRLYGTYSENKLDDVKDTLTNTEHSHKQKNLLFSADYVFMKQSPFRPFVGGTLGGSQISYAGDSKNAFAWGAQAGVLWQAGPIDAELGVQYLRHDAEVEPKYNSVQAKFKNKDTQKLYLSVAYRF